jgi:hypothetical protein
MALAIISQAVIIIGLTRHVTYGYGSNNGYCGLLQIRNKYGFTVLKFDPYGLGSKVIRSDPVRRKLYNLFFLRRTKMYSGER